MISERFRNDVQALITSSLERGEKPIAIMCDLLAARDKLLMEWSAHLLDSPAPSGAQAPCAEGPVPFDTSRSITRSAAASADQEESK